MENEIEIDIKSIIGVIYKRKWTTIFFFSLVTFTSIVYLILSTPVYRATTQILIEREIQNIVDFKEPYSVELNTNDFYNTQYKIFESRLIAKNVIDKLSLMSNPTINPDIRNFAVSESEAVNDLENIIKNESESADALTNRLESENRAILRILDSLIVEPIRNTHLLKIHYESVDPELAAKIANAFVESYTDYNLKTKISTIYGASQFLQNELEIQREKLNSSELALQEYKERNSIISLDEKENITVSKLAELNSEVLKAEIERVEAETRYQQVKNYTEISKFESAQQVVSDTFINSLKIEEANILNEISVLSQKFGEKHPKMISLYGKLRSKRELLKNESEKVISRLKNSYEISLSRENTLKKALEELKHDAQNLGKKGIAYRILEREVNTNKEMYNILLTRLKETGVTGNIPGSHVRLLDIATVPEKPVRPKKFLIFLLSIFFGVGGGILLSFALEYIDDTIEDKEDLKNYTDLTCLSVIPMLQSSTETNSELLLTLREPRSGFSEAIRELRTAIIYSSPNPDKKGLLVTSALPSEGKSTISANLAVTLSKSGYKTLLVDADFRKPSIYKYFSIKASSPGISDYLVGQAKLTDITYKTKTKNLHVIPCGHIPPEPSELLGSDKMKQTINLLKKKYDRIIFDTAPLLPVTDTGVLARFIEDILIIIRAEKTPGRAISQATEKLREMKCHPIGAVINSVDIFKDISYGYRYGYKYGYRYGYGKKIVKPIQNHTASLVLGRLKTWWLNKIPK